MSVAGLPSPSEGAVGCNLVSCFRITFDHPPRPLVPLRQAGEGTSVASITRL